MKPGIQPPGVRRIRRIGGRHHQPVRLHAAVDLRNVAADHQAGGGGPGRLAFGKLRGALLALFQQLARLRNLVRLEELVVLKSVADGFLINEDVGEQRIGFEFGDGSAEMVEAGLQFGAILRGDFDAGRRYLLGLGHGSHGGQKKIRQALHAPFIMQWT